jgi:hypothetical protein
MLSLTMAGVRPLRNADRQFAWTKSYAGKKILADYQPYLRIGDDEMQVGTPQWMNKAEK